MNANDATEATVESVARRLASEAVVHDTVRRIAHGRRVRSFRTSIAALLAIGTVGVAGWAAVHMVQNVTEPATPVVELGPDPLEVQLRDAVEAADYARMDALIDAGANLAQEYGWNLSIGAVAMQTCDITALRLLDDAGARRAPSAVFPYDAVVLEAAKHCGIGVLDEALAGSDGSVSERAISSAVATEGSLEVMTELASRGYPLDDVESGWSTIADAASIDRFDMVVLLLELGADPSVVDNGRPLTDRLRDIGAPQEVIDAADKAIAGQEESS